MCKPLLSIVVPVYNVEQYLDTTVNSLRSQSLEDIEIILVDDESPDNCPQMCDKYAMLDGRIKVIHKKNQGLGYARNSGLGIATGKYVTFIDSDDYIDLNAYEHLCSLAEENELDVVRFACNRFEKENVFSHTKYDSALQVFSTKIELNKLALSIFSNVKSKYHIGGSSCMAIYNRDILKENNLLFLNEREYISEDFIFNFEVYQHVNRLGYVPNTYYHYRVNYNSITQTLRLDKIQKVEYYSKYVTQLMYRYGYSVEDSLYAKDYYIGMCRGVSKSVFASSSLSMKEKKEWFLNQMSTPYFMEVSKVYPYNRLNKKQKICFWAMKHKLFYLTYSLIVGFTNIRERFRLKSN